MLRRNERERKSISVVEAQFRKAETTERKLAREAKRAEIDRLSLSDRSKRQLKEMLS